MTETPQEPTVTDPAPGPKLAEAKPPAPTTEYLVLSKEAGFWKEEGKFHARSAKAAIREYLPVVDPEGVYVAVPARSWQPTEVKAEQQTKITLT